VNETTRAIEYTIEPVLYLAFELGKTTWKLGFSTGLGQSARIRAIDAGELADLREEIDQAKKRFRLPEGTQVRSCYEAGRDGFWLHRYLASLKVANLVVDSASIEVNRRARRSKTDRLDVGKLLTMLIRYHGGEQTVWSVVHVPSVEAEDLRHLHRQLCSLKVSRTRHLCRVSGLLATQGVTLPLHPEFLDSLAAVRLWDGSPLPPGLMARLKREYLTLLSVEQEIQELEKERETLIETSDVPCVMMVRQLMKLKGIGPTSAWLFVMEFFAWRQFRNRREVGALAGLSPTPYQSGEESHEQGISKAGNRRVRAMAIEIAWGWLQHQPNSELSRWYYDVFGEGGKRRHKIGVVALARKLLVALWRYLETGEIPAGAVLKA
jgi:transposase